MSDGFGDTVVVALPEGDGDPVAGGTLAWVPATGVSAACLVSASSSRRSTTPKETTMSATAADRNSHRLSTGPP